MTSLTESFNHMKHTPLYKIEQNEREIIQWRLLLHLPTVGLVLFLRDN